MSDDLFSAAINDIANGPKPAGYGMLTKELMRRLADNGLTLAQLSGPKMMNRSVRTLEAHAREYELAFPDYVPLKLRPVVEFVKSGDFFELRGELAPSVAERLGATLLRDRDGTPMTALAAYMIDEHKATLEAAWFVVKVTRPKAAKATKAARVAA